MARSVEKFPEQFNGFSPLSQLLTAAGKGRTRSHALASRETSLRARHLMNEKELAEFIAALPEHLRFFFEKLPPDVDDPEEKHRYVAERMEKVIRYREELIAHGIDADLFLARVEPALEEMDKANAEVEKAEDNLLNAQADLADAEYTLFKESDKVVKQLEEAKPFDPQVQEWREQLDEWAKQFPKDEEAG